MLPAVAPKHSTNCCIRAQDPALALEHSTLLLPSRAPELVGVKDAWVGEGPREKHGTWASGPWGWSRSYASGESVIQVGIGPLGQPIPPGELATTAREQAPKPPPVPSIPGPFDHYTLELPKLASGALCSGAATTVQQGGVLWCSLAALFPGEVAGCCTVVEEYRGYKGVGVFPGCPPLRPGGSKLQGGSPIKA